MTDLEVCAFFTSALPTSSLVADVKKAEVPAASRGVLCAFEGLHKGVLVALSVIRGREGDAVVVYVDAATRVHACYDSLLSPPQRPDCRPPG